jgi:SAM-dependent methyltransferase
MYHLLEKSVQQTCVQECLRVLKPGGILAAAYVNRLFIFPSLVQASTDFLNERWMKLILEDRTISSADADCFWTDAYFHTPDEMESRSIRSMEVLSPENMQRALGTRDEQPWLVHMPQEMIETAGRLLPDTLIKHPRFLWIWSMGGGDFLC